MLLLAVVLVPKVAASPSNTVTVAVRDGLMAVRSHGTLSNALRLHALKDTATWRLYDTANGSLKPVSPCHKDADHAFDAVACNKVARLQVSTGRGDDELDFVRFGHDPRTPGTFHFGPGRDYSQGLPGPAREYGGRGTDAINGSLFADEIHGGPGGDATMHGLQGNDLMYGGKASDSLVGDTGEDVLHPGPGRDFVFGNGGADRIHAVDGSRDWIDCGRGDDFVHADPSDQFLDRDSCESVIVQAG
jgi:hypothetical protein